MPPTAARRGRATSPGNRTFKCKVKKIMSPTKVSKPSARPQRHAAKVTCERISEQKNSETLVDATCGGKQALRVTKAKGEALMKPRERKGEGNQMRLNGVSS